MRRKKGMIIGAVFCVFFVLAARPAAAWEGLSKGISGADRIRVIGGVQGSDVVYAGTDTGLYKMDPSGKKWERLALPGGKIGVSGIAFSGKDIFVSTEKGLYAFRSGDAWDLIPGKKGLRGVARAGEAAVLVWTAKELFLVGERSWQRIGPAASWKGIEDVATKRGAVYVASAGRIFYSADNCKAWNRYFLVESRDGDDLEEVVEEDMNEFLPVIRKIDPSGEKGVTVATESGIFIVDLSDNFVEKINTSGLPASAVTFALCTEEALFAAAGKRVFLRGEKEGTWHPVFESAAGGTIKWLKVIAGSSRRRWLWVATEKYIYRKDVDILKGEIKDPGRSGAGGDETDIIEVQRMAIEYAEVSNEKIQRWRRGARWKALLPRLSLDFNESYDDNIEIYKNSSTAYVVNGPRERDNGWGVDLTWDLSDLIWNESQTSIDVRSKLMVQLRENLLEEVTRLYFERKRLLSEVERAKTGEGRKFLDKELRIEELTAYIDALTGGGFSGALKGR